MADSVRVVRELARRFLFQTIHDVALMIDREMSGREASSSAAVIDSQSVKAPHGKTRSSGAGKKVVSRKRHIAVDNDRRFLMVHLTSADISDSAGGQAILDGIRKRWPWVKHMFADGAYDRLKLMDKAAYLDVIIEIIRRSDTQQGFKILPRRWGGRTHLRLDDQMTSTGPRLRGRLDVSQATILVAMGGNLLRRTTHP